jgi:hypothetical protein
VVELKNYNGSNLKGPPQHAFSSAILSSTNCTHQHNRLCSLHPLTQAQQTRVDHQWTGDRTSVQGKGGDNHGGRMSLRELHITHQSDVISSSPLDALQGLLHSGQSGSGSQACIQYSALGILTKDCAHQATTVATCTPARTNGTQSEIH